MNKLLEKVICYLERLIDEMEFLANNYRYR